jgi:hypothetical protein
VSAAHQAAGLHQAAAAQRRFADEQPRSKPEAAGELVGLVGQRCAQLDRHIADGDAIADFEIEPGQQRRIDRGAEGVAVLREHGGQRHFRIGRNCAEQRIGGIDRLDLDQGGTAVGGARHGPRRGGDGDGAVAVEKGALVAARFALDQRKGQIAAEDQLTGIGDAVGEARRYRADAGDRQHAERDAGNEDAETAHAAAQLAPGEAQRHQVARLCRRRQHHATFGMTRASNRCVGAKTNSGRPIISPANQT